MRVFTFLSVLFFNINFLCAMEPADESAATPLPGSSPHVAEFTFAIKLNDAAKSGLYFKEDYERHVLNIVRDGPHSIKIHAQPTQRKLDTWDVNFDETTTVENLLDFIKPCYKRTLKFIPISGTREVAKTLLLKDIKDRGDPLVLTIHSLCGRTMISGPITKKDRTRTRRMACYGAEIEKAIRAWQNGDVSSETASDGDD